MQPIDLKKDLKRKIGENIRKARGKIKQKELAETAHIAKDQISRYETGKTLPTYGTLEKIADALKVPLCLIAGEEAEIQIKESKKDSDLFHEGKGEYFTTEDKKLLDSLKKILKSGNKVAIRIVGDNLRGVLEMVQISDKNDEDKSKGGD